jgi:YfiH family protein
MIRAANLLDLDWLEHGFGERDSVPPAAVRTVKQIHSSIVLDVATATPSDTGDALMSDRAGVAVGVKTADCVPILLVDSTHRVVAAVHAGWRGSAENIAAATVAELAARWNTRPENLRAAIGPSIGGCCYEVGADVARRFEEWEPRSGAGGGPVRLDLRAINAMQLRAAGVGNIWKSTECTFCLSGKFYSFRRERDQAGRMISFIGIRA